MRCLMRQKWTRLSRYSAAALCAAGVALGQADPAPPVQLADPHLSALSRSPAEMARIVQATAPTADFSAAEPFEGLPIGAATVPARTNEDAFAKGAANLTDANALDFIAGDGLFDKLWVQAPSSTLASDGLGPLYNARSCNSCHRNDGRGHPPEGPEDAARGLVLRLSVLDHAAQNARIAEYIATLPDPAYGHQLQDFATPGLPAEYQLNLTYVEQSVALAGGETASLRQPDYAIAGLGYGPLAGGVMTSPRVAQQMIGLGWLEAVPTADILALADPDDRDGDGISGRPSVVWSVQYDQPMLGRFGHKAGMPTLREQVAAAFATDIGISSPLNPNPAGDCTQAQAGCVAAPMGDTDLRGFEVDALGLDIVTLYNRNLAVPARRDMDAPEVLRGKQVFYETGCIACHTPKFVTARLPDQPEQSFQLIWPYTDMLLHDLGEGLADHRPDGVASGTEWRTAPLWGIGLTEQVSGTATFLHDGRARTVLEAILWHGGEAQAQRDIVTRLTPADRAALVSFIGSL